MKVFLDTNVLLSGLFGTGLCARLLDLLVGDAIAVLLDDRVLGEFERIARDKLQVADDDLARASEFLRRHCVIVPAAARPASGVPDPDDAPIIAAAIQAQASVFVTGDKALLELVLIDGLPIVSPRTAYERLRGLA